jgi:hypothetical protein
MMGRMPQQPRTLAQLIDRVLKHRDDATPALAAGRMYVRTLRHLICVRGNRERLRAAGGG